VPELPEVETILRAVAPRLERRRLLEVRFLSRLVARGSAREIAERVEGETVSGVRRHGKFLVLEFESGSCLAVHLGMTGKLLWEAEPGPYTRALLRFENGLLVYDDIRQFGRIEVAGSLPARVARLGPDPLSIPLEDFVRLLRVRRGIIKPLLLNQAFLRGLGNIYADEALFRARIHPQARAERIGRKRAERLHGAIREVLNAAIASGGSSISDYVDAEGRPGSFQLQHLVYSKAGRPCPVCSTPIRRMVIAQRGTHYCPRCQRP
jgi:formamidopyrimidine-DNA glycosylase